MSKQMAARKRAALRISEALVDALSHAPKNLLLECCCSVLQALEFDDDCDPLLLAMGRAQMNVAGFEARQNTLVADYETDRQRHLEGVRRRAEVERDPSVAVKADLRKALRAVANAELKRLKWRE